MAGSRNIADWRNLSGMVGFFAAKMHASPRALAEFGLVAVALILANPTPTSIYMGILLALSAFDSGVPAMDIVLGSTWFRALIDTCDILTIWELFS